MALSYCCFKDINFIDNKFCQIEGIYVVTVKLKISKTLNRKKCFKIFSLKGFY